MHFMEQWMHINSIIFGYGTRVAGSLLLLVAVAFGTLWSLVKIHDLLPLARGVELAVAVRVHGSHYVDRIFWRALQERAESSEFEAENILSVVRSCLPKEGS